MATVTYICDEKEYTLPIVRVPRNSLLDVLIRAPKDVATDDEGNITVKVDDPNIEHVIAYLDNMLPVTDSELQQLLDYYGVYEYSSYDLVYQAEKYIRDHMYQEDFQDHPMNTDSYHHLIKLTPELYESLFLDTPEEEPIDNDEPVNNEDNEDDEEEEKEEEIKDELLFGSARLKKRSWQEVQSTLRRLHPIFDLSSVQEHTRTDENEESDKNTKPRVLVAGGYIFGALFGTRATDIDIFFTGIDEVQAKVIMREFQDNLGEEDTKYRPCKICYIRGGCDHRHVKEGSTTYDNYCPEDARISNLVVWVTRTQNAISFNQTIDIPLNHSINTCNSYRSQWYRRIEIIYQFILRLYRSPSEVLHGFDVDSCCVGYDGKDIWMTPRCLYALTKGYNTVNFDLLSPSYEYRLTKYATRGVAIHVPGFNRSKVDTEGLQMYYDGHFMYAHIQNKIRQIHREVKERWEQQWRIREDSMYFRPFEDIWDELATDEEKEKEQKLRSLSRGVDCKNNFATMYQTKWRGLSLLLFLEKRFLETNAHPKVVRSYERLSMEHSDYSPLPYDSMNSGVYLCDIFYYLLETKDQYPQVWSSLEHLVPRINEWLNTDNDTWVIRTVNFPKNKQITFLRGPICYYDFIMDVSDHVFEVLNAIGSMNIGKNPSFKVIQPGEQMTNTFHRLVLEDNCQWYEGPAYHV